MNFAIGDHIPRIKLDDAMANEGTLQQLMTADCILQISISDVARPAIPNWLAVGLVDPHSNIRQNIELVDDDGEIVRAGSAEHSLLTRCMHQWGQNAEGIDGKGAQYDSKIMDPRFFSEVRMKIRLLKETEPERHEKLNSLLTEFVANNLPEISKKLVSTFGSQSNGHQIG